MIQVLRFSSIFILFLLPILALSFFAYTVFHQMILFVAALMAAWLAFYLNRSITERNRLNQELFSQAYELKQAKEAFESCLASGTALETQAFNERFLDAKLTEECNRARRYRRPLCCLLIAIDAIEDLSQVHGPALAKSVVQEVSRFIKETIRSVDRLVRYREDQFVMILPETKSPEAEVVAHRTRFAVEKNTFRVREKTLNLTVSVGYLSFDLSAHQNKDDVLATLEQALLEARKKGPNRISSLIP